MVDQRRFDEKDEVDEELAGLAGGRALRASKIPLAAVILGSVIVAVVAMVMYGTDAWIPVAMVAVPIVVLSFMRLFSPPGQPKAGGTLNCPRCRVACEGRIDCPKCGGYLR